MLYLHRLATHARTAWETLQRQARKVVAAQLISNQPVEPETVARQVLRYNSVPASTDHVTRLEGYIRRELPAVARALEELRTKHSGKGGRER